MKHTNFKKMIAGSVLAGLFSTTVEAAVVVGTYNFANEQLVDQVSSFSGTGMYNGTSYIDPSVTTADITDIDPVYAPITYIATAPFAGYDNVSIDLGFSQISVVNGAGADLALFFLWDQSSNLIDITLNGQTKALSFSTFNDSNGVQQVADGVIWNGSVNNNVLALVAEVDIGNFGVSNGMSLNSPLSISMTQTSASSTPVALSMVGALNSTTTVVPVPAAVWLFGSGLLGLAGVARRKR